MRVAVLSDIHGNLPALRAVLAEVEPAGVDAIVSCGDLVSGPMPAATLAVLRSLDLPFLAVRGNADRQPVEVARGEAGGVHPDDAWTSRQLDGDALDWLWALPPTREIEVDDLGSVLLCHGSPRDDEEILLDVTPDEHVAEALAGTDHPVVVGGHTHMAYDRDVAGHRLVNAGSVGWAFGSLDAHWAVLGPDVELRATAFDLEAAAAEMRAASTWPRLEEWIAGSLMGGPSREEATAHFSRVAADRREG